ncbi:MAG TPA: hypothetical protein EYQ50_08700 [Verrucomicrobiales bacterium]|nr:hypothetical protein [Verrucomicrobiales bacterium]
MARKLWLTLLIQIHLLQAWRRLKSIRQQSSLLTALIVFFLSSYLVVFIYLFQKGLRFIASFPGLGPLLIERLIFLLFAFLFILLLFSNIVIGYTNLFKNRETLFLVTLPMDPLIVFRWKFLESTLLASWGFIFLCAPLLAAYGMHQNVPWHFYPMTVVLILLFIVLPAVLGAWVAILLARHMDRRYFQIATLFAAILALFAIGFYLKPEAISDESLEKRVMEVLDRLLYKTRFAQFPFLPSYWLSSGVQNWTEGSLISAGFFMLVMLSYVLFLGMLSLTKSGKIFFNAFSAVQSRGSLFADWRWVAKWMPERDPDNNARGFLDKMIGSIPWLASDLKAMLVKDTRLFWRDTTQWGQTLVLFGLLGAYILNLRHFSRQLTNPFWIHLVSYLNLGACSLNLATLTTRFVYPQFSLEGKRIWIVGMAPLGINRVVKAKYWLATSASLVLTLGLTWLSCHMLKMSFERTVYFTGAITIMTFCLNGLATGLGVLYPNFKEDNPGKIVNGFGGTFCLILSFLYIVLSVVFLAVGSPWGIWNSQSFGLLTVFLGGFLVLSILVGKLPMVFALRRIKDYEF